MTDSMNLTKIIKDIEPDEIYNLAAMSHVHVSFDLPEYVANTDALGALRILEAIRLLNLTQKTKLYQASTSELYGKVKEFPQTEKTPFYPRSPYGVAKLYAYWITVNYREAYNIFASNGILFNHESPVRGETFVTRKITRAASKIALGLQDKLYISNLDAQRDWGHAKDYVQVMWMILQAKKADDWVIASGRTSSVRDFLKIAFSCVGIELSFKGKGINERGLVESCQNPKYQLDIGREVVVVDPNYFRPTEVDLLIGDPSKAKRELGWAPKYTLETIIKEMMESDLKLMKQDQYLSDGGFKIKITFNMISKSSKIYIAGHTGLVGSAILKKFTEKGFSNLIYKTHSQLDLINQQKVMRFFEMEKPEYVIIAAAKVGGIEANNTYRAEFIYNNLMIQTNIIHAAYINNIKKLIFLGSTCVYPKNTPQPIKEEYLLTSSLEYTNEPYAIAKIAGIKMCENYNKQYKTDFISLMPTNLYGYNDNFNLDTSHVIPALMRKIHLAKCLENNDWKAIKNDLKKHPINKLNLNSSYDKIISVLKDLGITKKKVEIWGSGRPTRDFYGQLI